MSLYHLSGASAVCRQQGLPIAKEALLFAFLLCWLLMLVASRQGFVAEAGASRKSVGPWGLFFRDFN
jgi:hypothetical protein